MKKDWSNKDMSTSQLTPNANEKIIQYLNDALSMENAAEERIQSRIQETSINEVKDKLKHHLDQTRHQKDRLKQIITNHQGTPTDAKADLPIMKPNTIDVVRNDIVTNSDNNTTTLNRGKEDKDRLETIKNIVNETDNVRLAAEKEIIQTEQDAIIENAEIVKYMILKEIAKKAGADDAIPVIDQNLKEEQEMLSWIMRNTPDLLRQLWPQIEVSAGARTTAEVQ
jgi:ferritin-like metal-binding protein YciE